MSWITPVIDWVAGAIPTKDDFNRIEGNTKDNHDRIDDIEDGTTKVSKASYADNAGSVIDGVKFEDYAWLIRKSGYVKLPNGLYIMWGQSFTRNKVILPTTLPNELLAVTVTENETTGTYQNPFTYEYTKSSFKIYQKSSGHDARWIAVGH